MPKRGKILGYFRLKKGPQCYGGNFWNILIDFPCGFLMIFHARQHQAMLILQGLLFGTLVHRPFAQNEPKPLYRRESNLAISSSKIMYRFYWRTAVDERK
jgi:hypothetical protein